MNKVKKEIKINLQDKKHSGFVLLEALIALLIFSMGILALVGLQGVMIKGTTEAKNRSDASFVAQREIAMMWANPIALGAFAGTAAVAELPNGQKTTVVDTASGSATVTITWQAPGESAHRYSVNARIAGAL
ncbi:MAG: type IV pilus modification PilV family protein [Methylophilaceae bacterium]